MNRWLSWRRPAEIYLCCQFMCSRYYTCETEERKRRAMAHSENVLLLSWVPSCVLRPMGLAGWLTGTHTYVTCRVLRA